MIGTTIMLGVLCFLGLGSILGLVWLIVWSIRTIKRDIHERAWSGVVFIGLLLSLVIFIFGAILWGLGI